MSKKNRYKFRNRDANRSASTPAAPVQTSAAVTAVKSAPIGGSSVKADGAFAQHTAEYRTIRNDMIRLVILNGIMLVAVFALYYYNRSSGAVEKLFQHLFKI